jgi:drug/metabolite transporter (DMT)-like permease
MTSKRALGIAQLLASGFFFGFLGLFGKQAFEKGVSPFEFLALRYLTAAAMMFSYIVLARGTLGEVWLGKQKVVVSILLGVLGYAVFSSFYFLALEKISASLTVILLYSYPVLVAIGGAAFFKEWIPRKKAPAIPLACAGLCFLVWRDLSVGHPIGIFFGFSAALFYSVYILLSSYWLKGVDPFISTFWIQLGAGLTLLAVGFRNFDRVAEVFQIAWPQILSIGFFCSVLAMSLFLAGLLKVKNWEASVLSMAEPVTGVAVGVLLLGEKLIFWQWFGVACVLLALVVVSIPERSPK